MNCPRHKPKLDPAHIDAEAAKYIGLPEMPRLSFRKVSAWWRFQHMLRSWMLGRRGQYEPLPEGDFFAELSGEGMQIGCWFIHWEDFEEAWLEEDGPVGLHMRREELLHIRARRATRHEKSGYISREYQHKVEPDGFYVSFYAPLCLNFPPESLIVMASVFKKVPEIRRQASES